MVARTMAESMEQSVKTNWGWILYIYRQNVIRKVILSGDMIYKHLSVLCKMCKRVFSLPHLRSPKKQDSMQNNSSRKTLN